jgi:DNA invertase Pin-like site-specific DNA recombinase
MTREERQLQLDTKMYKKKSFGTESFCNYCWACYQHVKCIADPRERSTGLHCAKAEERIQKTVHTKKKGVYAVTEEYMNGVTAPKKIAKRTGLSVATVRAYMCKHNLSRKRPYRYNGVTVSGKTLEIIKLLEAGEGLSDIARRVGVSRQWVHMIKKKYF